MPISIKDIMDEAAAKVAAENLAREQAEDELGVTKADLGVLFSEFKTQLLGEITPQIEEIKKATAENIPGRGDGAGRKGTETSTPEDERDADPVAYLIKKAAASDGSDEMDLVDRELIGEIFYRGLTAGLRD